jgi:rubrerythrin
MNPQLNELMDKIKSKAVTAGAVAAKAAEASVKKAGEIYKITKLNIKAIDLESEIDDLFQEIGGIVYAAHKDAEADTSVIDGLLAEIDSKKVKVRELREEENNLRSGQVCAKCGAATDKKNLFCPMCGEKF